MSRRAKHIIRERPYQCSVCSMGFTRDNVRNKHERKLRCLPSAQDLALGGVIPAKRTYSDFEIDNVEQKHRHTFADTLEEATNIGISRLTYDRGCRVLAVDVMDTLPEEDEMPESVSIGAEGNAHNAEFAGDLEGTRNDPSVDSVGELLRDGPLPMDTLELLEGNSAASDHSSVQDVPMLDISDAWSYMETTPLVAIHSDDSGATSGGTASAGRMHRRKLNKYANKCTICKSTFKTDMNELRAHLYRHLQEQKQEWLCETCDVGFIHEADFKHHLKSATQGHCGFNFTPTAPCSGHHHASPTTSDKLLSDHDRFKLGSLLRSWELSQLQLHEASIQQLAKAQTLTGYLKRSSFCDAALRKRQSFSSLLYSRKTFTSEPHDAS